MKPAIFTPRFDQRIPIRAIVDAVREIIVVDGSSTDGTQDILAAASESPASRIACQPINGGWHAAASAGFMNASSRVVIRACPTC